jgi:hypothetical protein
VMKWRRQIPCFDQIGRADEAMRGGDNT